MPNIFDMTIKDIFDYIYELRREIEEKDIEILKLKTAVDCYKEREAQHE